MTSSSSTLRTLLGQLQEHAQATCVSQAHGHSKDLLPISVHALYDLQGVPHLNEEGVFHAVVCMTLAINCLYCNPWRTGGAYSLTHPSKLSKPQVEVITHLSQAAYRWMSSGDRFPGSHEFEVGLANVKVDYTGELVGVRRRIVAEL
eukprot:6480252-Amphidinium_carterae.1